MSKLVVIHCSEDGDKTIEFTDSEQFLKGLNEGDYGDGESASGVRFAKPGEKIDMDYFVGMIVVAGEVVVPKPKQVVTEYEL